MAASYIVPHRRTPGLRPVPGFTLIELLIVIGILAVLSAIMFPVFAKTREKARQISCLSNVKQLSVALGMYAQDYDGRYPAGAEWGAWYWVFLAGSYVSGFPANHAEPAGGVHVCPSNRTHQHLSNSQCIDPITPEPATSWRLGSIIIDNDGDPAYAFWCSYGMNQHVAETAPALAMWEKPSESFLLLEASDSDLDGSDLDELFFGHSEGTNIAYHDGHAKWHKATYQVVDPNDRETWIWQFPPGHQFAGGSNDVGGWTPEGGD